MLNDGHIGQYYSVTVIDDFQRQIAQKNLFKQILQLAGLDLLLHGLIQKRFVLMPYFYSETNKWSTNVWFGVRTKQ